MPAFAKGDRVRVVSVHVPDFTDRSRRTRHPEFERADVGRTGQVVGVLSALENNPPGPYYYIDWDKPGFVSENAARWEGDLAPA